MSEIVLSVDKLIQHERIYQCIFGNSGKTVDSTEGV